jgi:hypothetical protein
VWVVFGVALLLWLLVVAGAEGEDTSEAYLGAAVVMLVPLGMYVYAFRRFRAVHNAAQWAAAVLAALSVLLLLHYVDEATAAEPASHGAYRPPVTSITAPVV